MFQSVIPAIQLLESRVCSYPPRLLSIFHMLQHFLSQLSKDPHLLLASTSSPQLCQAPQQELAQLHRVNRSFLRLCTRATSTRCSNLHLHHGDLLPHKVVRHMIVTRSAQLGEMHAAWPDADRRDAALRRTHCSTIYCGRFLGGWQTLTVRWSGKKLSWIVYGTLPGSSTTPPETTGQERASWMARIPQQFRMDAESLMQLQAARQPDELVCRQSLTLRAVPTLSCGVTRTGSTSRS